MTANRSHDLRRPILPLGQRRRQTRILLPSNSAGLQKGDTKKGGTEEGSTKEKAAKEDGAKEDGTMDTCKLLTMSIQEHSTDWR